MYEILLRYKKMLLCAVLEDKVLGLYVLKLENQRDIFIFQSLIGCRVGDLYKMTKDNVINNAIEYIPRKIQQLNHLKIPNSCHFCKTEKSI